MSAKEYQIIKQLKKNDTDDIEDNIQEILKNLFIVTVISIFAWGAGRLLATSIYYLNYYWFAQLTSEDFTKSSLIIFSVLLSGASLRLFLINRPTWHRHKGDGVTLTLNYFYETYQGTNKDSCKKRYENPTFISACRRFCLTFLSIGMLGSGGVVGPSFSIGESIGAWISKIFNVRQSNNLRLYQMAGISAIITSLLHTPIAAAIVAAEVVFARRIIYRILSYSLFGSVISYLLTYTFFYEKTKVYTLNFSNEYDLIHHLPIILFILFFSIPLGFFIKKIIKKVEKILFKLPVYLIPITGALFVGGIAVSMWYFFNIHPMHILGVGDSTLSDILKGDDNLNVWWLLVLLIFAKIFATSFTVASGSSGIIVPALYIGGMLGSSMFLFLSQYMVNLDYSETVFIVVGMASVLSAVVEIPLAVMLFILEVYGSIYSVLTTIVCVATYLLIKKYRLVFND